MDKKLPKLEVLDLLEAIEDKLENVASVPLTGKIMLDRIELIDIIKDINSALPDEYQHVKWVYANRDAILQEAEKEAEKIIEDAEKKEQDIMNKIDRVKKEVNKELTQEQKKMIDDHEIVRLAEEKAEKIIKEAKTKAKEMRSSSFDYSENMLKEVRKDLKKQVDLLDQNLDELNKMK
jgi:vacuolar-type H+-ATPase subunit E/Vma4